MNAGGISEKGRELAAKNREEFRRKKFGSFKGNRIKTDSEKYMSYPMARGPNDETGDTLLIKCVKYQPPSPETEMGLEDFTIQPGNRPDGSGGAKVFDDKTGKEGLRAKNFGMTADARARQKQEILYYVELPIPQDINDTQSVTWG